MIEEALALHRRGELAAANALYRKILTQNPENARVLYLLATIELHEKPFAALGLIDHAIAIEPGAAPFHTTRGRALAALGRFTEAIPSYERALSLNPHDADTHFDRANALCFMGRFADALSGYDLLVAAKADFAPAHCNRGAALCELGRFEEALASYDRALTLNPQDLHALNGRGTVLYILKRFAEALTSYHQVLSLAPLFAQGHYNFGNALKELGRFDDAIAAYDSALVIKPDFAEASNNRGNALFAQKRFTEALLSYDRALTLRPNYADALNNRGNALRAQGRFEEALISYDKALASGPERAEMQNNRGNILRALRRFPEALAGYERALLLKPNFAEAFHNRGTVFSELRRLDEAIASYTCATALNPAFAEAFHSRGLALYELNRFEDALASYDEAIAINPDLALASGDRIRCQMLICDWRGLDERVEHVAGMISAGKNPVAPFAALAMPLSASLQRKGTETFVREKIPAPENPLPFSKPSAREKLRIGYFSADFHSHATAFLMAELFELHDRENFEITAFSFGPAIQDSMRTRLEKAFDHFIELDALSDNDAASVARRHGIDIAVDLKGFTKDSRPGIFAARPAPIQVNYLGYPGTMGADFIDYIIADPTIIPEDYRPFYSEKIVALPNSYQVNDRSRAIASRVFSREECGLPETGFVFCCFNSTYKITPQIFDIWMRLLGGIEGSILWLLSSHDSASRNLKDSARTRGITPERLVFAKPMELPEHLARHRLADLFLDTLPYNAHTTSSDALWAGLPVLTCLGDTFAGRVGASLLKAIGLPELIAHDVRNYEARAFALARDEKELSALRARLQENRLKAPLFDTPLFARHIEVAYKKMWERHMAALPPDHIRVAD